MLTIVRFGEWKRCVEGNIPYIIGRIHVTWLKCWSHWNNVQNTLVSPACTRLSLFRNTRLTLSLHFLDMIHISHSGWSIFMKFYENSELPFWCLLKVLNNYMGFMELCYKLKIVQKAKVKKADSRWMFLLNGKSFSLIFFLSASYLIYHVKDIHEQKQCHSEDVKQSRVNHAGSLTSMKKRILTNDIQWITGYLRIVL